MRLEVPDLYDYFISVGEEPHFQTVRDRLLQHKCNQDLLTPPAEIPSVFSLPQFCS